MKSWLLAAVLALQSGDPAPGPASVELGDLRALAATDDDAALARRGLPAVRAGGALAGEGEALALVARALSDLGRGDEAAALLESAEVDAATRGWVLVERARLLLAEDELAAVVRLLQDPDADEPRPRTSRPVEAWIVLAHAHARSGRAGLAGRLAAGLLEADPLHPEGPAAWHLVERAHLAAGDLERARDARARGARLRTWHAVVRAHRLRLAADPDAPEPRFGLALAWLEVEEIARARTELERLARTDPDFCRLWFHLGETRRLMNDPEAALEAFDHGVACDPDDAKCRFQRAELRYRRGDTGSARADFEHLLGDPVAEDPRFAALHLRLAQLAEARGDATAVEVHYAKYRSLGGTSEL